LSGLAGAEIAAAADHLRAGGVVAFPTETVYGLGADALSAQAVERVFAIKGRPSINPLIVHVSSLGMAHRLVVSDERARALASAFWPGPLTMVLPRRTHAGVPVVPDIVTAGLDSVAIRMPRHPIALALIEEFHGPIVGPSANPSGSVSPTRAEHVHSAFGHLPDVRVLDGGPCTTGIESTVLALVDVTPRVLRLGAISVSQLAEVLETPVGADIVHDSGHGSPLRSPGSLLRHYAPKTPVLIAPEPLPLNTPEAWAALRRSLTARLSTRTLVVITQQPIEGSEITPDAAFIAMPLDAAGYARELYAALRKADQHGAGLMVIDPPPGPCSRSTAATSASDVHLWNAIWDRISRAARGSAAAG
jgi:L-threonylcarbamoyladenylate synthase